MSTFNIQHSTLRFARNSTSASPTIQHSTFNMISSDKSEMRKQMFAKMEEMLKDRKPEDSFFYYHSSEDRIVLSHALFWVMTQNIKGKMAKQKFLLLLRQYQEEMLKHTSLYPTTSTTCFTIAMSFTICCPISL